MEILGKNCQRLEEEPVSKEGDEGQSFPHVSKEVSFQNA